MRIAIPALSTWELEEARPFFMSELKQIVEEKPDTILEVFRNTSFLGELEGFGDLQVIRYQITLRTGQSIVCQTKAKYNNGDAVLTLIYGENGEDMGLDDFIINFEKPAILPSNKPLNIDVAKIRGSN